MPYVSILTEELIEEAYSILRAGNYQKTVCALLKIPRSSYHDWYKRGKEAQESRASGANPDPKDDLYVLFYERCYQAKQEVIAQLTLDIVQSDDMRVKYKLLRAWDPRRFTEHYETDDATGEVVERRSGADIMAERIALLIEGNSSDEDE